MRRRLTFARSAATVMTLLLLPATALAQGTWDGGAGNGNWSAGNNWDDNLVPAGGAGTTITMAGNVQVNTTQNIANPFALTTLSFAAGGGAFQIGGQQIDFVGDGASLVNDSNNMIKLISAPLRLNTATTTFSGASNNQCRISGVISEAGGARAINLNMTGTGSFSLEGNNTFSGGLTLTAGKLVVGHNNAAGSGTLSLNGGTIRASTANNITLGNAVSLGGNVQFGATESNKKLTFTGGVTITGNNQTRTMNVVRETTFNGAIGDGGNNNGLTKTGAGILRFNGNNTYGNTTTLMAGTTYINGTMGGGNVVADGNQTFLGGNGVAALAQGKKLIMQNGARLAAGQSPGILTLSGGDGLLMTGGSVFDFEFDGQTAGLGAGFHDQVRVLGDEALVSLEDAFLNVTVLGDTSLPIFGSEYTIIDNEGPSSVSGQFNGLSEGAAFAGTNGWLWEISYLGGDGNDVVLTSLVPEPGTAMLLLGSLALLRFRKRKHE